MLLAAVSRERILKLQFKMATIASHAFLSYINREIVNINGQNVQYYNMLFLLKPFELI